MVADELVDGSPAHELVGLSTATGKVELTQDVDPAGSDPAALLQRTGLTLDAGRVVFGFGGNYGDCSSYHGWVISVPEAGGTPAEFAVDSAPGESQGAIWMGGAAPVVDANGNIWVEAGNGSVYSSSHAYDDSDSVLELSPSLTLLQYFAPSSWASNNASDLDMSTAPALLADGQVVAAGKSRIVYLLERLGPRRDRRPGGLARRASAATTSTAGWPWWARPSTCPACGHDRRRGHDVTRPAPPLVELGGRWRPADRRGRAGLDHRPGWRPLRARPVHGGGPGAGVHRRGRQPLPHPVGRRRPPAGPRRGPGGGVLGPRGRGDGDHHHDDGGSVDDHHHDGPASPRRRRPCTRAVRVRG